MNRALLAAFWLTFAALVVVAAVGAPSTDANHGRPYSANVREARQWAREHVNRYQWPCLDRLIHAESGWAIHGYGPITRWGRAYGLGQALPPAKMRSAERPAWGRRWDDWRSDGLVQIAWTRSYIRSRYGTMCHALAAQRAKGWF